MIGIVNLFLPLFIQVLILYFFSRMVNRLVLQRLGRGWYLATMWPGVVVHELSHLVACWLTFTKVFRVHLFYPEGNTLGFVEHAKTRNPLKNAIISLAPLFGVTAVMALVTRYFFPELFFTQIKAISTAVNDFTSFQNFFSFTGGYFGQYLVYLKEMVSQLNFGSWPAYFFIYFMLTLSSHAAPSKEDLENTYFGLAALIAIFALLYYIDQWLEVPLTWLIVVWLTKPLFLMAGLLTYGIIFGAFSLLIMIIVSLLIRLFKRDRLHQSL